MFNIVLVTPQIPGNTGTIGRICVATNSTLHLIKPLGFNIDDKSVKRAGLDYWGDLKLKVYDSLNEFLELNPINDRHFFATTKSSKNYFEAKFKKNDFFYFGREDGGLPEDLMQIKLENKITIPMSSKTRSINLGVSVGIILYEAIKQNFTEVDL